MPFKNENMFNSKIDFGLNRNDKKYQNKNSNSLIQSSK